MDQYFALQRQILAEKSVFLYNDEEIKAALEDDSKMDEILATIGANKASFRLQALKSTKSLELKICRFALILSEVYKNDSAEFGQMINDAWKVLNPTRVIESDVVEEHKNSETFVEIDLADLTNINYVIGRSQPPRTNRNVSLPDSLSENLSDLYSTAAPENVSTEASGLKKISRAGETLRSLDDNIEKLHAVEDNGQLYRALTLCPKN